MSHRDEVEPADARPKRVHGSHKELVNNWAACARSVEAVASVSTGDSAATARSVEAVKSVGTAMGAIDATSRGAGGAGRAQAQARSWE